MSKQSFSCSISDLDLPKLLTSSSEVHADHSIPFKECFSLEAYVDEIVWSTVCL